MVLSVSDGEIVESNRLCEECVDAPAAFHCDFCLDDFCVKCFWKCHLNGSRRHHTVTKVNKSKIWRFTANNRIIIRFIRHFFRFFNAHFFLKNVLKPFFKKLFFKVLSSKIKIPKVNWCNNLFSSFFLSVLKFSFFQFHMIWFD